MNGPADCVRCVSKLTYWSPRPKLFPLLGKSRQKYDTKPTDLWPNLASL